MTRYKALYPRDDIDRLKVLRKEGGRGYANSKLAWMLGLEENIKKCLERYITASGHNYDNVRRKKE